MRSMAVPKAKRASYLPSTESEETTQTQADDQENGDPNQTFAH